MSGESTDIIWPMTVSKLLDKDKNYFIRFYQRGYRWSEPQVTALLNDIDSFDPKDDSWYCLQPLVVREIPDAKKTEYGLNARKLWYEVIDGQQRLTTIFLIIHYFNEKRKEDEPEINEPEIRYETRKKSEEFLKSIKVESDGKVSINNENIDYHHISIAYRAIHDWIEKKPQSERDQFKSKFQECAGVIWYPDNGKDTPIEVFRRLNRGKIPLTSAELVKALFLSGETMKFEYNERLSQYKNDPERDRVEQHLENEIKLKQLKIASEWDQIEKTLNEKSFWAFLTNEPAEKYPARIEFLLEMIVKDKKDKDPKSSDDYAVLNYYSKMIAERKTVEMIWEGQNHESGSDPGVMEVFETIREWYTNRTYYHLVGFLISQGIKVKDIFLETKSKGRNDFKEYLKEKIRKRLESIPESDITKLDYNNRPGDYQDLKYILTLFNIITIDNIQDDSQRYPFASHKDEQWTLEHIHAQNPQELTKKEEWRKWLEEHRDAMLDLKKDDEELLKEIKEVLESFNDKKKTEQEIKGVFDALSEKIINVFRESDDGGADIHTIENMALIGSGNNSALNNSVFAVKRRKILEMDKTGNYIPICTKNVFFKYYNKKADGLAFWGPRDRSAYVAAIKNTLEEYLP